MSTLEEQIAAQPYWYHKIELPGGVTTPGWAPLSREAYRVPADLTGKRVLDVGAWDGFWTFEALKRNASQVVAIDDFSDYLGTLETKDRKAWTNFDLCREAFGYPEERCQRIEMSTYDVSEEKLGLFDVVFFFGTLYHLRHPLLALDKLASVCQEEIYVESAILDDFSPYRGGLGKGYPDKQMVMEFYPGEEYGKNKTNWWAPTSVCLAHMVRSAGFDEVQGWKLTDKPTHLSQCRGFARGRKTRGAS
jgi:tRNA (mo5U34)-methyltransferase